MTKKHHWLSKSTLLIAFAISLFLFSSCSSYDDDITKIEVTFTDEARIIFGKDGGTKSIELKSNKDWAIAKGTDATWIEVSPTKGLEGAVTLTVNVEGNDGEAREGSFTIIASESEKTITVTQNGKDGAAFEYITIKDVRSMYADSGQKDWRIAKPLKMKGVVISDAEGGNNLTQKEGFIQDETGGAIAFRVVEQTHSLDLGDMLNINLEGATVFINKGALMVTFSTGKAKVQAKGISISPKELTIEEIVEGSHDATLVKLKDVQFRTYENLNYYDGKATTTNRALENEYGVNIIFTTTKSAKFKDEPLPAGVGNIVGVVSQVNGFCQIAIRSLEDMKEMSVDASTRFAIKEPPADGSKIVMDKENVTFGNKGGNETINIRANVDWAVKSDESWLTITPNSGNNDGAITVTANENKGGERKAIITITDGTTTKTVMVTQRSAEENGNFATDLFFSEYVEGSSNNKYLEIYNGTGKSIDLSDYKIELYVNGQTTVKSSEILTGILENEQVIVLKHAKATIYDGIAITSNTINYNGNDAIALIKISTETFVDIFGRIGENPEKAWTTTPPLEPYFTTLNSTLVRKPSVSGGVKANPKKGFPTLKTEWIMYPVDTADYLGSHTMN